MAKSHSKPHKKLEKHTANTGVQFLIAACKAAGIKRYVISPGSRSAPLVIEISADADNKITVIPDERCAGYYALGIAQQLRQPVGIVCTSGTAVLNLAPAVCEAYYQRVPIVVLSADRPHGAAMRGENQALFSQEKFMERFTLQSIDYPTSGPLSKIRSAAKYLYRHIAETNDLLTGPIHINVRLDEPLYTITSKKSEVPDFKPFKGKTIKPYSGDKKALIQHLASSTKRMILVGMHPPDVHLQQLLTRLAVKNDTVIVTDILSNQHVPNAISLADACLILGEKKWETLSPDCLITLGGPFTSKRLRQLLTKHPPEIHIDLSAKPNGVTVQWLPNVFRFSKPATANDVLNLMLELEFDKQVNYPEAWQQLQAVSLRLTKKFASNAPYSDFTVLEKVLSEIPAKTQVQLGNSTVVRYAGLFAPLKPCTYFGNRGASGIDGCVSTAAGAASTHDDLTLCIVGDVSFLYDSNALWNKQLSPNLRIVVINNGGGNIFRWLDGPTNTQHFEQQFEATHQLTAKNLATMYQLPYYICRRQKDVLTTFHKLMSKQNRKASILEIQTNNITSADVYKQYIAYLKQHKK